MPFLGLLFVSNLRRRYPVGERKNESTILDRSPFAVVALPVNVEVEATEELLRGRKCEEKGSEECVSVGVDGYDDESEIGEEGESRRKLVFLLLRVSSSVGVTLKIFAILNVVYVLDCRKSVVEKRKKMKR